jgi:hypothetical protein
VQVAHAEASGPHPSLCPTHWPVVLHLPLALQAFRPSSQARFAFFGVEPQVPLVQLGFAQSGLVGAGQTFGVLTQTPALQRSSVQALLSVHAAVLLSVCTQPEAGLQLSFVHGLLSLQVTAGLIGVLTQTAVAAPPSPAPASAVPPSPAGRLAQVSVVHALLSEQFLPGFAESIWQVPSKHLLFVQASPSSQTVPSARRP